MRYRPEASLAEPRRSPSQSSLPPSSISPQHVLARDAGGRAAGVSCHAGYVNNQGDVVSLAMLGHEHTELGTELILTWGEPNGGARKPQVEQHEQSQIRVTVAPAPCNGSVQRMMRATVGS